MLGIFFASVIVVMLVSPVVVATFGMNGKSTPSI